MKALSLVNLPIEVLVNVFSHLDESDFHSLEHTCKLFERIVHDEELWKTLFLQRNGTLWFPSFSRSDMYSIEYVERNTALNQWRHNRATKTKYSITHDLNQQVQDISDVVFDFPRCACYNEGMVTFLQLKSKRKKDRVAYIQCTTPHGTSVRHFNINAVVFGRYDGRIFGKLLTNKSYLSPVTEFDHRHFSAVTSIVTTAYQDSPDDICVSGDESGEVIWWRNTHKIKQLKVSSLPIADLRVHKRITVAIDLENIYVIDSMEKVHSISLQATINSDFSACKFTELDFGGRSIVLATMFSLHVISIDIGKDFGNTKVIDFPHPIQELDIDEATIKRHRDPTLPGGDGCMIAILLEDNTVHTINIRTTNSELKTQAKLSFKEDWITCQINNLVLVCAFNGMIGVYDALTGHEVRVIQNSESFPEFLDISHGHILVGKGSTLFYYQYVSDDTFRKRKGGKRAQSNKWNENLHQQLRIYDEEEQTKLEHEKKMEKIRKRFVGDLEDEELQFQIALMESEAMSNAAQRSLATSQQPLDDQLYSIHDDANAEISQALRQSEAADQEIQTNDHVNSSIRSSDTAYNGDPHGLSDSESLDEETKRQLQLMDSMNEPQNDYGSAVDSENEELALAIALSLSQMDN